MRKAPKCPKCGSFHTVWKEDKRIFCKDCRQRSSVKESKFDDDNGDEGYMPSILILDIETAPAIAAVWGFWKQNVHMDSVQSDWFCISWAAKWLGEKEVMGDVLTPREAIKQDDRRIMKSIYDLINKADIVIAHNADKFDIPRLKLRFLVHGFQPPHPFQVIDTLKVWKREFGSLSNKLDYLNAVVLNLERKVETGGMQLWNDCMNGDYVALDHMLEYNKNDVAILEQNYLKIRPWIHSHPNMSLYQRETACPNCGSNDIEEQKNVYYFTSVSRFQVYRCNNCGNPFHSRFNANTKEQKKKIVSTCAR